MVQQGQLTILRQSKFGFHGMWINVTVGACLPRVVSLHLLRQMLPYLGPSIGWSSLLLKSLMHISCNHVWVIQHLTRAHVEHSV